MRISDWSSDVCSSDDLVRQRSEISVQMGANHPQMQALSAQIVQVSRALVQERASVVATQQTKNDTDAGRERALALAEATAAPPRAGPLRTEARRVGKACVSTW